MREIPPNSPGSGGAGPLIAYIVPCPQPIIYIRIMKLNRRI